MSRDVKYNNASKYNLMEHDVMITPDDMAIIQKLHSQGWGQKRIAKELGFSKTTVKRYLNMEGWQGYQNSKRKRVLDGKKEWIRSQFLQHRGNAEVVRQELEEKQGIQVSLRTVERAVAGYRQELKANAKATLRFETAPGKQMQIDFGSMHLKIGEDTGKVFLFVATLSHSRRIYVAPFHHEGQVAWFAGMEGAFRYFGGVPEEILMDNAKALVTKHDKKNRKIEFNENLLSFARYWRFKPKACAPYRAQTKGKDERAVGYVKGNAIAGRSFKSWSALEGHLSGWSRNVADQHIHGTTQERPIERFKRDEAHKLRAMEGKPPLSSRARGSPKNPQRRLCGV